SSECPDSCSKPVQRFNGKTPSRSLAVGKAEAQKRSVASYRHRALRRVDLEFQPRREEERDAFHHPLSRSAAANVHITVVRIPHEAMTTAFELTIKRVQHDVRYQRRQRAPLRGTLLRSTDQAILQSPRVQPRANEFQHACIRHALGQATHQEVMIHSVEKLF